MAIVIGLGTFVFLLDQLAELWVARNSSTEEEQAAEVQRLLLQIRGLNAQEQQNWFQGIPRERERLRPAIEALRLLQIENNQRNLEMQREIIELERVAEARQQLIEEKRKEVEEKRREVEEKRRLRALKERASERRAMNLPGVQT
ncbi:hypothetical protein G9A89_015138 [Geosiphon pyriformis]|nr:hypothetical protein G9A89_015138 [Geosiphon pyriformis]